MMETRDAKARREELVEFWHELRDCQKCALAGSRTQVVFGNGNADATPGAEADAGGSSPSQAPGSGVANEVAAEHQATDRAAEGAGNASPDHPAR